MPIVNRITRPANQALPPAVVDGVLLGRTQFLVATAYSKDGTVRWWRIASTCISAWAALL